MILTGENWSTGRKTLYCMGGRWINECGEMVEWYQQGNTEVAVQHLTKGLSWSLQFSHAHAWHWTRDSVMRGEPLTASATLRPNSVIILPLTQQWKTITIYGAPRRTKNLGGGGPKGCISDFVSNMLCISLHGCTHSVSSGITTGRTPTFTFCIVPRNVCNRPWHDCM